MSIPIEGSNPLRPYYVPPSASSHSAVFGDLPPPTSYNSNNVSSTNQTSRSLGSSARNILADIDYSEYLSDPSPSSRNIGRSLVEQAIWKYTSIFLAQPFDVAKTVLQAQKGDAEHKSTRNCPPEHARLPSRNHHRDPYEVFLKGR